jgi:hypothetical protein
MFMADHVYESVEDVPEFPKHLKYNLYFESFYIQKQEQNLIKKDQEVLVSPIINSMKIQDKSKYLYYWFRLWQVVI